VWIRFNIWQVRRKSRYFSRFNGGGIIRAWFDDINVGEFVDGQEVKR
jgi:hypothetical protein